MTLQSNLKTNPQTNPHPGSLPVGEEGYSCTLASPLRTRISLFKIVIMSLLFIIALPLSFLPLQVYGSPNMTSPDIELGRKVYEEIKPHLRFVENPFIKEYVERLGRQILKKIPANEYEFRFFPIVSSDINAFALSNGYIFVTNKLIQACDSEEELAFVLSHEIAHVIRGHLMKFLSQKKKLDFATLAVMVLGAIVAKDQDLQEGLPALGIGLNQNLTLSYSREQESEADTFGLRFLTQAGYDMNGAVKFMEKLRVLSQVSLSIPAYLSTHPMPIDRLINLERLESVLLQQSHPSDVYNFERLKLWTRLETDPSINILADLQSIAQSNPNDIEALYGLALVKENLGASEDAEEYYKKGLSIHQKDRDILRDYGIFLYKRGRLKEAESELSMAIVIDPNDFVAYHSLGRIMMDQNFSDRALKTFLKSRQINPEFPANYHFLGILYSQKGDQEKSHECFEQYFTLIGNRSAALLHSRKKEKKLK